MRIVHTADWHLGDRLGRIDRTEDLRQAVERIAGICHSEAADVLIVAGDLFSELARPDTLREAIRHWQQVFHAFLTGGGTILTVTGNHDNENFCQTLRHAMTLAAPMAEEPGARVSTGRLYLAAEPTLLRVPDRSGQFDVQFLLMPYPTATRYLHGDARQRYTGSDEKHKLLVEAFEETLQRMRSGPGFAADLPAVLVAHVQVQGANIGSGLFRLNEQDDLVVPTAGLAEQFAYVALGHVHKPQTLGGHEHIRYSGSIERMDLGEQADDKSCVIFDVGAQGLQGPPRLIPLPSTRIARIELAEPEVDLPRLQAQHSAPSRDLVNLHVRYAAGRDSIEQILRDLDRLFPRWYARDWVEESDLGPSLVHPEEFRGQAFAETVRGYLGAELAHHDENERIAVLEYAEALLREME